MALRFTVLASGSAGNASFIDVNGFGVLLDAGLGPRQLASRLAAVGASWQAVHAVLLTHTHSDHWRDTTLTQLHRRGIPFYCHAGHHETLRSCSPAFATLCEAQLVRGYEAGQELGLSAGISCIPFAVRHDGGPTFGFRVDADPSLFGHGCSFAYAADLGSWDADLADTLADVELLALEFNHDVAMQHASGRHPRLIARILGDEGHLSNDQAAGLLREVVRRSPPERLRHLVQLHLSRECNRPTVAAETARRTLEELAVDTEVHTASQDCPGATFHLGRGDAACASSVPRVRRTRKTQVSGFSQLLLPGMEA